MKLTVLALFISISSLLFFGAWLIQTVWLTSFQHEMPGAFNSMMLFLCVAIALSLAIAIRSTWKLFTRKKTPE